VVDVGVGQQYEVYLAGRDREPEGQFDVDALRQTAVDKDLTSAGFKVMAASRDFARRPEK